MATLTDPMSSSNTELETIREKLALYDERSSVLRTELECTLCLCLLCEPISISCGHTFCRLCLVKSLARHKKKCPTCRAICHTDAISAPENFTLKKIIVALYSDEYSSRLQECATEKENFNQMLPVFFYNACLYVGASLSLHLFEPRYRIMAKRISESTRCNSAFICCCASENENACFVNCHALMCIFTQWMCLGSICVCPEVHVV